MIFTNVAIIFKNDSITIKKDCLTLFCDNLTIFAKSSNFYFPVMQIDFKVKMNENLFLRDPEGTEIGKQIVRNAVVLIAEMGYEQFNFKKLAVLINSTEATVYRYFENKHRLLIYLIDWYWSFIEFQVTFQLNNIKDTKEKIKKLIDILVWEDNAENIINDLNTKLLFYIAMAEGSKTYLVKEVDENNSEKLYLPYKDLCNRIAQLFIEHSPTYKYPNSLASTLIETALLQYYFMHHLPALGNYSKRKSPKEVEDFLQNMVFGALACK